MQIHRNMGALCASFMIVASLAARPSFADPVMLAPGGYPAPGGTMNANNGVLPIDGTRVITYTGFDPSQYSNLYYVIGDYPAPSYNFDPTGPHLSADGTAGLLSYNAGMSNLAAGMAVWTGSTTVPTSGGAVTADTRFVLSVYDLSNNPLSLTDATTISGMPSSVGGALPVPNAGFIAHWQWQMSNTGTNTWVSASSFENNVFMRNPGYSLADSVGGGFYFTAPVPVPAAAWLLVSGLGGVCVFARRRRAC